ncbi:MAG: hypothetical protein AAGE83_00710 [Pseudomonadota bacterium]
MKSVSRWAPRRRLARGFGIPEALVAMLIAGGITAVFYETVSTGSLLRRTTETRAALALQAFLILDRVGQEIPLRSGLDQRGRTDGMIWRVVVTDSAPVGSVATPLADPSLLHVYVSVSLADGDAPTFEFHAARYRETPL